MSDGRTHEIVTLAGSVVVFGLALYLGTAVASAVLAAVGITFGGVLLSPDLDLKCSLPHRRWGVLDIFWRPYCNVLSHRHILSHGWLIGSFIRLCYLGVLIAPVLALTGLPPAWTWSFIGRFLACAVLGSELHLLTDLVTTGDNDTGRHWI